MSFIQFNLLFPEESGIIDMVEMVLLLFVVHSSAYVYLPWIGAIDVLEENIHLII
jgi:hypothetical protein